MSEGQDQTLSPGWHFPLQTSLSPLAGWSEMPCRAVKQPSLTSGRAAVLRTPASSQGANGSPPSSRWQFSFKSKWQKAILQSEEGVCSATRQRHWQSHSPALARTQSPLTGGTGSTGAGLPSLTRLSIIWYQMPQKFKQRLLLCCHRNPSAYYLKEKLTAIYSLSFHSH